MKKTTLGVMCLILALLPLAALAVELKQGEQDTIFISDLKIQPSVREAAANSGRSPELRRSYDALESQLTTALNSTRVFQLVERKHLETLTQEQKFSESGLVDTAYKNAAQTGKLAGARFVFIPMIDGFEDIANTQSFPNLGRVEITRSLYLSVMVKVIDTTTGALLPDAPSVQLKKEEVTQILETSQPIGGEAVVVGLAKEMAQRLTQELVALLRPAKVLTVSGKQVLFNRGSDAGFAVGDQVEIYAIEKVKDDETGEFFRNEIPVGQAKIVRIDKKQSFALINGDDLGIAKGCVVKIFHPVAGGEATTTGAVPAATESTTTPGSSEKPLKW